MLTEILYADDFVLTSEALEGLRKKSCKWREAFESKGLKINLHKTKIVVSGTEGERVEGKIGPCGVCEKKPSRIWRGARNVRSEFIVDAQGGTG